MRPHKQRKWIDPQDFIDLRLQSGLSRKQAAAELDVTPRTIQNWETSGARIPWMAYRMLRILRGFAVPGTRWEGWIINQDELVSPAGRTFNVGDMQYLEGIFAQARLWRQSYSRSRVLKNHIKLVTLPKKSTASNDHFEVRQIGGKS